MTKKIVIVGASAGGATLATRLQRINPNLDIKLYEQSRWTALADDAYHLFLNNQIGNFEDLQLRPAQMFSDMYGIDLHLNHTVCDIDSEQKMITAFNQQTQTTVQDNYDILVIATGKKAVPILRMQKSTLDYVYHYESHEDIYRLKKMDLEALLSSNLVIVGNNKQLIELANLYLHKVKSISLIISEDRLLKEFFDDELSQFIQMSLLQNEINLIFDSQVIDVRDHTVVLSDGRTLNADIIINAQTPMPNINLAKQANIQLGETGGIKTNDRFQTSVSDIYAVGSCTENEMAITHEITIYSNEGYSQQSSRKLANIIVFEENDVKHHIVKKVICLFNGVVYANLGLTEADCEEVGISCGHSIVMPGDMLRLLPEARPIYYKLIFNKQDGRILGVQLVGRKNLMKHLDVIAVAIYNKNTVYDMKEYQLSYTPEFGNAKEAGNIAALNAINLIENRVNTISFTELRKVLQDDACIIDTRSPTAFQQHHIIGSINLPYEELDDRIDEIPKDKPVYLYCTIGQRSSYMAMILKNKGFDNIYNIQGSILPLSFYEFYKDHADHRQPILSDYYLIDHY